MENWKSILISSITTPEALAKSVDVDIEDMRRIHDEFPIRINPYYFGLIKAKGDPIWKQAIPDIRELAPTGYADPLSEEEQSPVPNLVHRYPDRVLFYVSATCSMFCRFCTRKRKVGDPDCVPANTMEQGFDYIRSHREIRDVIISGGDPLMLSDEKLEYILQTIRAIKHVQIIRIGSRMPVTLPQRITESLCTMLKQYHPLFLNTHFNHPAEITPEAREACRMLIDAGIPLGNQSVLLKGVNDTNEIMLELVRSLLSMRVRPYYLYQADLAKGTDHFRTPIQTGLEIIRALRGHTSGLAVPHYVVDTPGGGGKIALIPDPVVAYKSDGAIVLKDYKGGIRSYPGTNRMFATSCILSEASVGV